MNEDLRRRLAAVVGLSGVAEQDVVRPADVDQLREVVRVCAVAELSVGPAVEGVAAEVRIDGHRLTAVRVDPRGLLLHAGAAAGWASIRNAAAAEDLAIAALPGVRTETVGEAVAQGELAHRTLAGVTLLTRAGRMITAGGRTLKDVVGYDLPGLVLGSGERLGLLMSVSLRLEPAGAQTAPEPGPGPWRGDAGVDLVAAFS